MEHWIKCLNQTTNCIRITTYHLLHSLQFWNSKNEWITKSKVRITTERELEKIIT